MKIDIQGFPTIPNLLKMETFVSLKAVSKLIMKSENSSNSGQIRKLLKVKKKIITMYMIHTHTHTHKIIQSLKESQTKTNNKIILIFKQYRNIP